MSNQYVGEIRYFPYRRGAPEGWLACDGSLQQINAYQTLFALIGTTYGGDGQTTFAVPDLRGRVPIGTGREPVSGTPYQLGQSLGQERVTLTTSQLPPHTHQLQATATTATGTSPGGQLLAAGANMYFVPATTPVASAMAGATIGGTGQGQPHENCAPTLAILPCICTDGVYPSPD